MGKTHSGKGSSSHKSILLCAFILGLHKLAGWDYRTIAEKVSEVSSLKTAQDIVKRAKVARLLAPGNEVSTHI